MIHFVSRHLRFDIVRSALTVTALAAVVAVILVLEGFYSGLLLQLRNTVLDRQADLIATQAGVTNMIATRSILPQFSRGDVEAIDGVAAAHPLTGISIIYEQRDERTPVFLFVHDTRGGPNRLLAGTTITQPRDIVIDQSLAVKHDLCPGDAFVVSNFEFRVSGIAEGAAAFFTPFGFARYDDLIDFYFESDIAADISAFPLLSFWLIELSPGSDAASVAAAIEAGVPEVDVFLPDQLAAQDESLGRALIGPIMGLMVIVAYVIGAILTGMIMFATVNARRREFGTLKALGFSNQFLAASVVAEAVVIAIIAIPLGAVLAAAIAEFAERTAPLYVVLATQPGPLLRTSLACLAFAAVGALGPVGLIRNVDPVVAFRS
jgi:putative ABC transport system permease protein